MLLYKAYQISNLSNVKEILNDKYKLYLNDHDDENIF